ncbi:hypothetical protein K8T06_06820, partial [bacterium]|nr:hypothetical protein [bacterium]
MMIESMLMYLGVSTLFCLGQVSVPEWSKGRYWYFVENIHPGDGKNSEILLWAAIPINHKGQMVKIGEIHPEPIEIITDHENGNQVVFWQMNDVSNRDQIYFYYDFEVLPSEVKTIFDPDKIIQYDKNSQEYEFYTKSENWIELTSDI